MNIGSKKWTVGKEKEALQENLKTLKPGSDEYKATLDAIEQCGKIQNDKNVSVGTVFKYVGGVLLCAVIGVIGYSVDKSDEIPKNKLSKEFFGKIFKL